MSDLLTAGQWQGFFRYGPEYGDLEGAEAEFRLFVESIDQGQFTGRIIDWEGVGADGEVATVEGFIKNDFISFVKTYQHLHGFDELGNTESFTDQPGHQVVYEGHFNHTTSTFEGTWEIAIEAEHTPVKTTEHVATGTWHMHHQR